MTRISLSCYLIKSEFDSFDDLIRENVEIRKYNIENQNNLDGMIFVGNSSSNSPRWLELLQRGATSELPILLNSSTRAVLFIKNNESIFAFPFGFGRYLIRDEVLVKDFGIKVVLNSVDSQKLRSVDKATINEITIQSRTQTSKTADVNAFGIDVVKDFLRSVTGEPKNEIFGKVLTGRDSVQFTYNFEDDFGKFKIICDYLEEKYYSEDYKADFSWVDNLQIVNDVTLKNSLDNILLESINKRDSTRMHLAPSEIIEWSDIEGFSYTQFGEKDDDLNIEGYFLYLDNNIIEKFTIEKLKRHRIFVWDIQTEESINKWKLYDCIVFETDYNGEKYILTVGHWFRIDRDFANLVNEYIKNIPNTSITLPDCYPNEKEGEYNSRVGREIDGVICLDTKLISYNGSRIEICDLFTEDKKFIHVKPWRSSSTLSHLFSQGRVSGENMFQDIEFRKKSRRKISEINEEFVDLISEENYKPEDFEVVFAIIESSDRELEDRLPFFSKLNMMQSVQYLKNIRYKVTKTKIKRIEKDSLNF